MPYGHRDLDAPPALTQMISLFIPLSPLCLSCLYGFQTRVFCWDSEFFLGNIRCNAAPRSRLEVLVPNENYNQMFVTITLRNLTLRLSSIHKYYVREAFMDGL